MIRVCLTTTTTRRLGIYSGWTCAGQPLHGAPLNIYNAKNLSHIVFKEPTPYPGELRVAATQGYNPLNHRGGWRGVSPEELAHGMVFAVADARTIGGRKHRPPERLEAMLAEHAIRLHGAGHCKSTRMVCLAAT